MEHDTNRDAKAMGHPWLHLGILTILAVTSVSINVRLAKKLREMKDVVAFLNKEDGLVTGTTVPAIRAKDINDNPASISFSGVSSPTILYVFSPSCGWCAGNLANAKHLARTVAGRFRFYGVSLSDERLRDYVAENGIDFPVYAGISEDTRASYKMGATPQTIVVSSDGKILKSWSGAYLPDTAREIEQYFNVHLPGMIAAKH